MQKLTVKLIEDLEWVINGRKYFAGEIFEVCKTNEFDCYIRTYKDRIDWIPFNSAIIIKL